MPGPVVQYAILALLFTYAAANQADEIRQRVHVFLHAAETPAEPFSVQMATRTIGDGPFRNDQILAIDGRPFNAYRQYPRAVRISRPGDKLRVTLSEPSGLTVERMVEIPSAAGSFDSASKVVLVFCVDLLMPTLALLLGFAAAAIRPRDWNAWLLLLMMLSFTEVMRTTEFQGFGATAAIVWHSMLAPSWGIWMLLFGISFPDRLKLDARRPWLKYLLVIPAALMAAAISAIVVTWTRNISAAVPLRPLFARIYVVNLIVDMMAIGGFFASIAYKSAAETTPDGRRRLRILRTGAGISLSPMFGLVLYSIYRDHDVLYGVPWPVTVLALLLFALFPVTLAYAIVVERAMDLRFVVRQGVRYGFARGGLWIVRLLLISTAIWLFTAGARGSQKPFELSLVGVGLLVLRKRAADKASVWLDRRFFREAYDAENVLLELAGEVGRYVEIDPLLETVARRIADTMHVPDIVILLPKDSVFVPRYSTRRGEQMNVASEGRIANELRERAAALEVYFDNPPAWIRTLNAEELQTLDFMSTRLLLPIASKDRLIGMVSLGPKLSEQPYTATDIRLLQGVVSHMAMAVENSRLVESLAAEAAERERANRELEIAREVQERLFPRNPVVEGCDIAGYCRPARGVGGDYYDFLPLGDGRLGIAIGDVSGKGIAAALLMASLQASLRGQTLADVHDLSALMNNVNKLVYEASTANRYATFFYGEYEIRTKRLHFVNAGHNPPVILRGDHVLRLEAGGPVVGLLPAALYGQDVFQLQSGDIFVAYTDGISEAMDERDEEWEEERFIAAARECDRLDAKRMIERIFAAADAFTGKAKQYDDMTLVVMKVR